jgi:diadenosine tetraphosphate (Ap4A) HIT family hydrolase
MPKRHVHSLSELDEAALLDIMKLLAEYEGHEYNVYARAAKSTERSVSHLHTHLIRIGSKSARGSLYVRKAYFLVKL